MVVEIENLTRRVRCVPPVSKQSPI